MPTNSTRPVNLLVAFALFASGAGALAGCGSEMAGDDRSGGSGQSKAADRAREVAVAWDNSQAAASWRKGYYPMGAVVQPPANGLHGDDKRAYERGNFDLGGVLPVTGPQDGQVTWANGASLSLPVVEVERAYRSVARSSSPGPRLVVTRAKLGEMTVATSRGPATVPAWLFTLRGYKTPLSRAAVNPSKPPRPPIGPARAVPADVLAPLGGLSELAADGRSVTVVATHGSCDKGPAVNALETDSSVVLSASVIGSEDGNCTSEMRGKSVTVRLKRPVGDRVLLDAYTGRTLSYNAWGKTAPSGG
ncbi:hypothetical protein [Streptomyces sp. NPDC005385]|uniref:hypothetical protein n=1 Tax=Streptomyces sp. NPDC005385 TaxID=3157039 RepID=UPI0033A1AB5C